MAFSPTFNGAHLHELDWPHSSEIVVLRGVESLCGPARGPGKPVTRVAVVMETVPTCPQTPHVGLQQVLICPLVLNSSVDSFVCHYTVPALLPINPESPKMLILKTRF